MYDPGKSRTLSVSTFTPLISMGSVLARFDCRSRSAATSRSFQTSPSFSTEKSVLMACLPIEKEAATRYAYSSSTSGTLMALIGAVLLEAASTSLVKNVVSVGAVLANARAALRVPGGQRLEVALDRVGRLLGLGRRRAAGAAPPVPPPATGLLPAAAQGHADADGRDDEREHDRTDDDRHGLGLLRRLAAGVVRPVRLLRTTRSLATRPLRVHRDPEVHPDPGGPPWPYGG